MKKVVAGFVALTLASGTAYGTMDCCKDGKCICCDKKGETPKDGEHKDHKM
jgi:hypothetical protein